MLYVRQKGKFDKSHHERHFLLKSLKRHRIYQLDNVNVADSRTLTKVCTISVALTSIIFA